MNQSCDVFILIIQSRVSETNMTAQKQTNNTKRGKMSLYSSWRLSVSVFKRSFICWSPIWREAGFYRRHNTGGLCTFSLQPCTLTRHRSCLRQPEKDEGGDGQLFKGHKWDQRLYLRLSPVSASLQPCRSWGTRRLCASPPGLGDRRLKPLQEILQVDCQCRKLHQSRGAACSLLLQLRWTHHCWGASLTSLLS